MNKVRIYTVEGCPYCIELKEMLKKDNVEFTEVDVNLPENEEEFKKLHEFTKCEDVPMVKVGRQVLIPNTSFQSIQEAYELTKKFLI
jgi:glutaredoxin